MQNQRFSFGRKQWVRRNQSFFTSLLDNARIHHARMVKEFLREEGPCFHFLYLPPYSPQLNPIERLWKWLKDTVFANAFHKDRHEILQAVQRFVHSIQERLEDVLRRLGCVA
nr:MULTISPECIES: transposase [Geobacillus]